MSRALDQAKAMNQELDRMRRQASVMAFELKKMARGLGTAGSPAEPHWLDEMAQEIITRPRAFGTIPAPSIG
jgi:hypothetical protein